MIEEIALSHRAAASVVREQFSEGRVQAPCTPKLSMHEVTTYRWSLKEDVAGYLEAGVDAIGVWRPKLTEFGEARGIGLVKDSGLSVSTVSWAGGFTGSNGQSFDEAFDDARDAIRIAAELDAECVVVVSGSRSGHTLNHARRLLVDALKSLGDLAGENDLMLAVLPMHAMFEREWTFVTSIDSTLDVLQRCNHSRVRMSFDVYHLWQEPRLLERIPEIAPLIGTVQLNDWREPPRSDSDRCLPGDGVIPLAEITQALIDAGYGGYFEMEIWSDELWESNYSELLDACRSRFNELFLR